MCLSLSLSLHCHYLCHHPPQLYCDFVITTTFTVTASVTSILFPLFLSRCTVPDINSLCCRCNSHCHGTAVTATFTVYASVSFFGSVSVTFTTAVTVTFMVIVTVTLADTDPVTIIVSIFVSDSVTVTVSVIVVFTVCVPSIVTVTLGVL